MEKILENTSVTAYKHFTVGKHDWCDFSSIQAALDHCSETDGPAAITILSGDYYENINLYKSDILIKGIGSVRIIGNRYARQKNASGEEIGTFQTATFFINGANIQMEQLEIINNAGPGEKVGQAVALYNEGDHVTFKNCTFRGYQDTVCLGPLPDVQKNGLFFSTPEIQTNYVDNRSIFIDCYIEGTVDFIFGGGEAVFHQCEIKSLKRPDQAAGFITAASTLAEKNGLFFDQCYITAEPGVKNVYLGRPWRSFAKTAFAHCVIGPHLHPDRWDEWGNLANRETVTYVEIHNRYHESMEVRNLDWIAVTK